MIEKTKIHNILFITLSNIGDVVLTLPVLGALEKEFGQAKISVMVSPQAKELFQNDPAVSKIISYDKHIPFLEKLKLGMRLRRKKFDLVVDLRSTLYPWLIGGRPLPCRQAGIWGHPFRTKNQKIYAHRMSHSGASPHKRYFHLNKLLRFGINTDGASYKLFFSEQDKLKTKDIFKEFNILDSDKVVAVAPGAKSHIKQWTVAGFATLCQRLNRELGVKVLLIGDTNDKQIASQILSVGLNDTCDITGRTTLLELGYLLSKCNLLITNDSAPLHLADIVGAPSIAIFGPTDEKKYGPSLKNSAVIRKFLKCAPCEKAQCGFALECMKEVGADEVYKAAKRILHGGDRFL